MTFLYPIINDRRLKSNICLLCAFAQGAVGAAHVAAGEAAGGQGGRARRGAAKGDLRLGCGRRVAGNILLSV